MRFAVNALLLLMLMALPLSASPAGCIATSAFSSNDEGWRVTGDAQGGSVVPSYAAIAGNPGGCIYATDDVQGGVWYWSAPSKFLGDISRAYGCDLAFDLKQSQTDSQFSADDMILTGAGLTLILDTTYNPGTAWTHYSVALSEAAGWKVKSTGAAPTAAQMIGTLSSLDSLWIRGEYRTGSDTGSLDNVVLNGVPEPGSLAALLAGMIGCFRYIRRGKG